MTDTTLNVKMLQQHTAIAFWCKDLGTLATSGDAHSEILA